MPSKNAELLSQVQIFRNLSSQELESIAERVEERRYAEDAILFQQGDPGEALLIVLEGRVKAVVQDGQREAVLAFFGAGDILGEMALLTGEPRSATAVALAETRVLTLSKESFAALLVTNVNVMREMTRVMAMRQFQMGQRLRATPEEAAEKVGKVYVVFGPRGGSGKTTIAVNLAVALAQMYPGQVGLFDLALTFDHCALALNLAPKSTLANVSGDFLSNMDPEELDYFLVSHPSTLKILVGADRPEDGEIVTGDLVRVAMRGMKRLFALTVVDTESIFSEATIAAVEAADKVLLVCAPELATIRDIRECQRVFSEVMHLPSDSVLYVMNHTVPFNPLTVDQFSEAVEEKMYMEIPFGNDLPALAAVQGEALTQVYPESDVARAIAAIARGLDGQSGASSLPRPVVALSRARGTVGPAGPMPRTEQYAPFWRRAVASLVDGVVAGVVSSVVLSVAALPGVLFLNSPLWAVGVPFSLLSMWLYYAWPESSAAQATPGKRLLGIFVTDLDGQRISLGRATGRFAAKIVSGLPLGAGYLVAAFTERKQALHDMIAGSLVLSR